MRRYFVVLAAALLVLASCVGGKSGSATTEEVTDSATVNDSLTAVDSLLAELDDLPMPKAADELFDDFVYNFVVNRKLQMERTRFPLPCEKDGKTVQLTKEQWKPERFFMRQGYYTLLFDSEKHMEVVKDTSINHAVVEKIHFTTNLIDQFVFNRMRGAWMLTQKRTIPIKQDINASFLAFYHKFVTDKTFQAGSLAETVQFVGPDPDDDFNMMEGIITPDTWEAFAPQLPAKMIYNIIYGQPKKEGNSKIFVLRGIANGLELEMTFKRKGHDWKLTNLTT